MLIENLEKFLRLDAMLVDFYMQQLKKVGNLMELNHSAPFSLTFETKSDSTYTIEVTQDFLKWDEIGEVKGTGSLVKFTDPRLPIVPFKKKLLSG